MSPFLILSVSLLLLLDQVASQGLKLPKGMRWKKRQPTTRCGNSAQCITIQQCQMYQDEENWRQIAEPCGRRGNVCCPIPRQTEIFAPEATGGRPPIIETMATDNSCGTPILSNLLKTPFVMGGKEAPPGMYPWMVAILKRHGRDGRREELECTGFLIDYSHALSAAHCFRPNDPSRYSLRIGNVDWRKGSYYEIARIDIPRGYRHKQYYNDLALLTLTRPVQDANVVPICLPTGRLANRDLTGQGTTVAGWGSQFHGGEMSDTLRHLPAIPVISNTECNTRLARKMTGFEQQFNRGISRGILCAGFLEGGKDSCGGDSGGPLMVNQQGTWYAVGIVSFGYECGEPGYPAGYTRISEYLDYIRRHTS